MGDALAPWHVLILLPFIAIYLVPTVVALVRKPPHLTAAIVVNLFLGWTLIGWVVALVLAVQSTRKTPAGLEPWRTPPQQAPGWQPQGWQPEPPADTRPKDGPQ